LSEATRSQLLDTGRRIFARQGLDGARVEGIARAAGVNKALINYHFQGKGGLYRSILGQTLGQLGDELEERLAGEEDPAARLLLWPQALWTALEASPELAPLLLRELLAGCGSLPEQGLRGAGRSFALLAQTLSVGRKRGSIERAEPFPLGLLILGALLMAQISIPLRRSLESTLTRDQLAGSRGSVVALLQDLIEQGLLIHPPPSSTGGPGTGG
jgi:AcrR family transcriptional regulator